MILDCNTPHRNSALAADLCSDVSCILRGFVTHFPRIILNMSKKQANGALLAEKVISNTQTCNVDFLRANMIFRNNGGCSFSLIFLSASDEGPSAAASFHWPFAVAHFASINQPSKQASEQETDEPTQQAIYSFSSILFISSFSLTIFSCVAG